MVNKYNMLWDLLWQIQHVDKQQAHRDHFQDYIDPALDQFRDNVADVGP